MERLGNALLTAGTILGGTALVLKSFFFTVDAGERAIIFNKLKDGLKPQIYGEGMHFYMPIIQQPFIFEVRCMPKVIASLTGTKDLQTVDIALRVLYRPIPEMLATLYITQGKEYESKILPSIGNEVLKSIVAQYDADQLLKKRETISNEIKETLIERAREFNLVLDDVSIIHLGFMKDYAAAIEHKQVAQQLAERQRFVVLRDEEEKNAQIIRAEGEADAARLINDSVKAYGAAYIDLKRLEASKSIAESLSKSPNITFVPTGQNGLLLNLRS
jgi:prohibitin 1